MATERQIKAIRKKLTQTRVGLPDKVVFYYKKGIATCYPRKRTWIIEPIEGKIITHIIAEGRRFDVTKYKARNFLKLALIGVLRDDK